MLTIAPGNVYFDTCPLEGGYAAAYCLWAARAPQ
jgi:hypothetical protein